MSHWYLAAAKNTDTARSIGRYVADFIPELLLLRRHLPLICPVAIYSLALFALQIIQKGSIAFRELRSSRQFTD